MCKQQDYRKLTKKFDLRCEQPWFRLVTKVKTTDISACVSLVFHIVPVSFNHVVSIYIHVRVVAKNIGYYCYGCYCLTLGNALV